MRCNTYNIYRKILFVTIASIGLFSCSNKNSRLIGEWKGIDNSGKTIDVVFDKSDHALFVINNNVVGGKEYDANGHKSELRYETNYSKTPNWLDFIIIDLNKKKELGRITGIFKFITDSKIELQFTDAKHNELSSNNDANTIVLEKIPNS